MIKIEKKEREKIIMKNKKKLNNKGFSLVELIIVIAIMAVLVGVLAPAYLRYVEKSRKSADIQAIDSIMTAMEVTAMGTEFDMKAGDSMIATFTGGVLEFSTKKADAQNDEKANTVVAELDAVIGKYTTRSVDFQSFTITGTVEKGGDVKFVISGDDATEILKYSDLEGRLHNTSEKEQG